VPNLGSADAVTDAATDAATAETCGGKSGARRTRRFWLARAVATAAAAVRRDYNGSSVGLVGLGDPGAAAALDACVMGAVAPNAVVVVCPRLPPGEEPAPPQTRTASRRNAAAATAASSSSAAATAPLNLGHLNAPLLAVFGGAGHGAADAARLDSALRARVLAAKAAAAGAAAQTAKAAAKAAAEGSRARRGSARGESAAKGLTNRGGSERSGSEQCAPGARVNVPGFRVMVCEGRSEGFAHRRPVRSPGTTAAEPAGPEAGAVSAASTAAEVGSSASCRADVRPPWAEGDGPEHAFDRHAADAVLMLTAWLDLCNRPEPVTRALPPNSENSLALFYRSRFCARVIGWRTAVSCPHAVALGQGTSDAPGVSRVRWKPTASPLSERDDEEPDEGDMDIDDFLGGNDESDI